MFLVIHKKILIFEGNIIAFHNQELDPTSLSMIHLLNLLMKSGCELFFSKVGYLLLKLIMGDQPWKLKMPKPSELPVAMTSH